MEFILVLIFNGCTIFHVNGSKPALAQPCIYPFHFGDLIIGDSTQKLSRNLLSRDVYAFFIISMKHKPSSQATDNLQCFLGQFLIFLFPAKSLNKPPPHADCFPLDTCQLIFIFKLHTMNSPSVVRTCQRKTGRPCLVLNSLRPSLLFSQCGHIIGRTSEARNINQTLLT